MDGKPRRFWQAASTLACLSMGACIAGFTLALIARLMLEAIH